MKKSLVASGVLACLCLPGVALAEATFVDPASSGSTTTAHVDITVVVPAVLSLRVGTGGAVAAADATIDSLVFNVPAAGVGNGTSVAARVTDGDLGNGALTVRVYSNVGTAVSLNSSVVGPLTSLAGVTIPWSEIAVASASLATTTAGFTNTGITHPAFNAANVGSGTATSLAATSGLVRFEGKWTYTYSNTNAVPAGSYGAVGGTNGRITYTASQV